MLPNRVLGWSAVNHAPYIGRRARDSPAGKQSWAEHVDGIAASADYEVLIAAGVVDAAQPLSISTPSLTSA